MHSTRHHFKVKILCLALTSLLPLVSQAKISKENPLNKSWQCDAAKDGKWSCYETGNHTQQLFNESSSSRSEKDQAVAKALGWIPDNNPNSACGGHYYQPGQYAAQTATGKTSINFGTANANSQDKIMVSGGVEISRGKQYISATQATISANPKTNKVQTLDAQGNVNLSQPGQLIISKTIQTNLTNNTASLEDTYYLLKVGENIGVGDSTSFVPETNFTGYARGHAKSIHQEDQNHFVLKDATYTTDSPYDHDWTLSASTIKLNKESGFGQAYNSVFHIQDIPVFYFPYVAFPINDKRKSGLLYPQTGYNSNSGYYYAQPYYFDLAPNYDLTLTPTIYTSRGFMLGSDFRYLTEEHQGQASINYMPFDTQRRQGRASFGYMDSGQYTKNLSSSINYNYVTDDDYFRDFDSSNIFATNQTLLAQEGQLNYITPNWNINGTILNYQVLDNNINLINQPYATLPQINFDGAYPNSLPYSNFGINGQFTYFYKAPSSGVRLVNGQRLYLNPYIEIPLQRTWGEITPKLALNQSNYSLQNTAATTNQAAFPDSSINRTLPIFNVGASLSFDKTLKINKKEYVQTLRPRIFYNYIPYRNQSDIPLFDTGFTNFTYNSLFEENRFTGNDRINNANQFSYALETEINDKKTGQLLFSAGIGQMVYFTPQKVSLCRGVNCIDNENLAAKNNFSDIVGFFNYQFLSGWFFQSGISFDQNSGNVDNQKYAIQYRPNAGHIFNLSYQNIVNDYALLTPFTIANNTQMGAPQISQVSTSALWKLTNNWAAVGLWNYDFNSKRSINMYAGLQYDTCSWALRFLAQRYVAIQNNNNNPTNISGPYTNAFVLQIQLKGLGGIGSGDLSSPLNLIPGYRSEDNTY